MKKNKVGILGGTFDPPHIGHLIMAQEALEQCNLDKIWFMPSASPPHKKVDGVSSGNDRVKMVEKMIGEVEEFELSLIEFEREGPSFTVDTMKELKMKHPDFEFYFIIGGDSVAALHTWERIDELMEIVTFIGIERPGHAFKSSYLDSIIAIETPLIGISSTMLRKRFRQKKNTKYYVTEAVKDYIEVNQLYDEG
ncbi:nicotinate-nucleotide adenylyltransferase [Pseudalkalibacillus sp. R45]|uniref:nicotinate-nucleotide adenylyltransferase n=1 Tax=Pseudalkalibacillus sp. R45 TaxID=3457433 RepID=UPI003FCD56D0